jgi:broad specificity phosphatase PhoE
VRRLLIVRHGESEWNREGRWQGWEDIALTPVGEAQSRARGAELHAAGHHFEAIHTSDLVRAARTAALLAEALGISGAHREPALRERFGGEWQGHTREEIDERWPGARDAWRRGDLRAPPGGETDAEVLDRVRAALARIDATNPPGPVLVVTHHGVVRQLSTEAGVPATELIPNLGGRWFDWDGSVLHASEQLPALAPCPEWPSE